MRRYVPWWLVVTIKVVASRIPLRHSLWNALKMFRHGEMLSPNYAIKVFDRHFEAYSKLRSLEHGFDCLELGPGESLFSAAIAYTAGATTTTLVDVADFVEYSESDYAGLCDVLRRSGRLTAQQIVTTNRQEYVDSCGARYLTDGLKSLRSIPSQSIDLLWSHAVLEHIRKNEFENLIKETNRVLKPGAVCSHRIDLKDHLGGNLNSLRFSDRIWESDFMARSGFYTNRLRYSEIIDTFKLAGFQIVEISCTKWSKLPTAVKSLHTDFQKFPVDELLISGIDIVARARN